MFETRQVTLNPSTSAAVLRILKIRGETRAVGAVVEEALQAWLQQAACDNPHEAHTAACGYQWKSLFLPDGTLLRFDYQRQTYHAQVCGDRIMYRGHAYSPRQLLLHVTGSVRNAWREIWIRSPGDYRWHLADTRRHILRRTPQGRHLRGIDRGREEGASVPAPPHRRMQNILEHSWYSAEYEANLRATLYRDDLVRPDQPDLSCWQGGMGRGRAGRTGKRDRRYSNYVLHS